MHAYFWSLHWLLVDCSLLSSVPPGFSIDWASELDSDRWVLTLTDRKGNEYIQVCEDGEAHGLHGTKAAYAARHAIRV